MNILEKYRRAAQELQKAYLKEEDISQLNTEIKELLNILSEDLREKYTNQLQNKPTCGNCQIELKTKTKKTNNQVFGPGYKEFEELIFHYCPKCHQVFWFEI